MDYLMESSSTSSCESTISMEFPIGPCIGKEALITSSKRELVEFYWTNQKRFLVGYLGFLSKISSHD